MGIGANASTHPTHCSNAICRAKWVYHSNFDSICETMTDTEDNSFDDRPEPPSKTRRKQEMHALQDIGEQLVGLNKNRLAQINLPETLLDAVIEAKRLTGHEARRRQMQYLGKLMRSVDEEPIRAKLDEWNNVTRVQGAKFHLLERWRERLLTDEKALSELVVEYARADIQQIRTLIRNAQKEAAAGKPPKSSRALFKLLREMILEEKDSEPEQDE
jgi:ribosome-associated protein